MGALEETMSQMGGRAVPGTGSPFRHAELKLLDQAEAEGMEVLRGATSTPICPPCQQELQGLGYTVGRQEFYRLLGPDPA